LVDNAAELFIHFLRLVSLRINMPTTLLASLEKSRNNTSVFCFAVPVPIKSRLYCQILACLMRADLDGFLLDLNARSKMNNIGFRRKKFRPDNFIMSTRRKKKTKERITEQEEEPSGITNLPILLYDVSTHLIHL